MLTAADRKRRLRSRTQKDIKNKGKAPNAGKKAVDPSIFGNVSLYDPKEGEKIEENIYICRMNIYPWIIKSDKNPDPDAEIGDETYVLKYFVHNNIGPKQDQIVCTQRTYGEKEIVCADYSYLWNKGKEDDARKLKPSYRVAYNIENPDDSEKEIQIFLTSGKNFHEVLMKEVDLFSKKKKEEIFFYDLENGYTITFRASLVKKRGMTFFEYSNFEFEKREPISESIYEKTYPLEEMLIVYTPEEIEMIHKGKSQKEEEETNQKKEELSIRKERSKIDENKKTVFPLSEMSVAELRKYIRSQNIDIDITKDKTKEDYIIEIEKKTKPNSSKKEKEECPYGHVFGIECDSHPEDCGLCGNTEVWERCVTEYDRIKKENAE